MNHKRGRAKNQRAGCLLCKPHKANGCGNQWNAICPADRRAIDRADIADGVFEHEEDWHDIDLFLAEHGEFWWPEEYVDHRPS